MSRRLITVVVPSGFSGQIKLESWGDIWRSIYGRLVGRPSNFWWLEDREVAGGSRPTSFKELEWVRRMGIKTIVSLSQIRLRERWIERLGLSYHHFPIKNHSVPTVDQAEQVSAIVDSSLYDGKPVMVHCSAGRGRTGCLLGAWLILSKSLGSAEAISTIRMKAKGAIEKRQEEFLMQLRSRA